MFSKEIYVQRRTQLSTDLNSGVLLFMGNHESPMNYQDNVYHFRQDSNFLYFFGMDQADVAAIIDLDENQTIIFGDELTIDHIVWMGNQPTIKEKAASVGVSKTLPYAELSNYLQNAKQKNRSIHYLPPYRHDNMIQMSEWMNASIADIKKGYSVDFVKAVINQRQYKADFEIVEMEKALHTTHLMHTTAMREGRAGITEAVLAGRVEGIAVSGGGNLAYPVIMTKNGQTLHNHYHGNILQEGDLVLGDFGAETATHYAGDITRTFPVSKKFTARQRDIYEIVLKAEVDCIAALKPGITNKAIHLKAAEIITDGLKSLGLMKGNTQDAIHAGAHALFFPHGIGHMIGMDVHDMEDLGEQYVGYNESVIRSTQFGLRSLRLGKALEEGFVITIEPGIYFIPELIEKWRAEGQFTDFINYDKVESYKDFSGIRIEDNCLITAEGHRILGPPIPKTIDEVEAIRG